MKWQIEQYSTGKVMTEVFFETEKAELLIELVAHMTGIAVDDLDAVWLAAGGIHHDRLLRIHSTPENRE